MKKEKMKIEIPKRNYEHFAHQNSVTGVGAHKNKKKYNRKEKHRRTSYENNIING